MATYVTGKAADDARRFTFSAATMIQTEMSLSDRPKGASATWQDIAHDLERAAKAAQAVANELYVEGEE